MYVKNLKIKNFRCFEDAEVALNYPGRKAKRGERVPDRYDNVNLFIGTNGTGKTSVFRALCLSVLAPVIAGSGLRIEYFVRRQPGDERNPYRSIEPPAPHDVCEVHSELLLDSRDAVQGELGKRPVIGHALIKAQGDVEELITSIDPPSAWKRIYDNSSPAFFLCAYGTNRRIADVKAHSERSRATRYERVAGIFEEFFGLVPFEVGYFSLFRRGRLQEAFEILNSLLPDDVKMTWHATRDDRPMFNSFGVSQPFAALSDGYRGFISWVWDLLYQMSAVLEPTEMETLFPGNQPSDDVELPIAFREMRGVVIVDEIDLFLHPRWQRDLIGELAQQFPKIQFLFSTHSPLVVGTLEAENIRVLTRHGIAVVIEQYDEEVEGRTPNDLLRSAYFGLSSTRAPQSGTLAEQAARELKSAARRRERKPIRPLAKDVARDLKRVPHEEPRANRRNKTDESPSGRE